MERRGRGPGGARRRVQRNATLDLLRGLAAITVSLDHYSRYVGLSFIHRGYLAVDFFFVLSGSVIVLAYGDKIGRSLSIGDFLVRRMVRLYPLFAVGMVLGILSVCGTVLHHGWAGRPVMMMAASLVPNSVILPALSTLPTAFPLNPPMWSLFFEILVNLLFAVWLVRLRVEELSLFVAVAALAMVWTVHHFDTLNVGWAPTNLIGGGVRTLFGFATGMLLVKLMRVPAPRVHGGSVVLCALLMGMLVIGCAEAWRLATDLLCALVIAPGLIAAGMVLELPERLHTAAANLGELAFPLYCCHFPLMAAVELAARAGGLSPLTSTVMFLPLSLAVAWGLLAGFDRPARRWLTARVDPRRLARSRPLRE